MRLFYRIDGTNAWNELDHSACQPIKGDYIICHSEEAMNFLLGDFLVEGIADVHVIYPDKNQIKIEDIRSDQNILFFTKPIQDKVIRRIDKSVVIQLQDGWLEKN